MSEPVEGPSAAEIGLVTAALISATGTVGLKPPEYAERARQVLVCLALLRDDGERHEGCAGPLTDDVGPRTAYIVTGIRRETLEASGATLEDAVRAYREAYPGLVPDAWERIAGGGLFAECDGEILGFCEDCGRPFTGAEQYLLWGDDVMTCLDECLLDAPDPARALDPLERAP